MDWIGIHKKWYDIHCLDYLGIQLSKTKFQLKNRDAYTSVLVRLLGGPCIAFVLIKLMGFSGALAQALMISTSVPTAVNSALIAVETDNHLNSRPRPYFYPLFLVP